MAANFVGWWFFILLRSMLVMARIFSNSWIKYVSKVRFVERIMMMRNLRTTHVSHRIALKLSLTHSI